MQYQSKILLSNRVIQTRTDFYCRECNTVIYRGRYQQYANVLTDNHQRLYCEVCGAYIGRIELLEVGNLWEVKENA